MMPTPQRLEIYGNLKSIYILLKKTILQWLHRPAVLKQFAKNCLLEGPKHLPSMLEDNPNTLMRQQEKIPLLDKKIFWQHDFHHYQVIKYSI